MNGDTKMKIMPVWIKEQDEKGVRALLGSEPPEDAQDEFVPMERIMNVVVHQESPVINGRRFAILVLRD